MSINYIISCWSGLRRENPEIYLQDRAVFLKEHFIELMTLKHSLDQITFVINKNEDEPKEFRQFIENLPSKIQDANVVIIERPNIGYSYGCYSDVFGKYRTTFDYYLLMEDDYTFLMDDFDTIMLSKMKTIQKCGFATFWNTSGTRAQMLHRLHKVKDNNNIKKSIEKFFPKQFIYPRVALGLVDSKMLDEVYVEYGMLPYASSINHIECKMEGQFGLSVVGQKFGWSLVDMVPDYGIIAFGPKGEIITHNPNNKEILVTAIQAII